MWDFFDENDVQDVAAAAPADAGNEEINIGFTELTNRQVKTPRTLYIRRPAYPRSLVCIRACSRGGWKI